VIAGFGNRFVSRGPIFGMNEIEKRGGERIVRGSGASPVSSSASFPFKNARTISDIQDISPYKHRMLQREIRAFLLPSGRSTG
jgi:hypothetical protein